MASPPPSWLDIGRTHRVTTPKSKPRTKPAEQRRDDLLDAAAAIVAAEGAEKITVDAVTFHAGVAKGTFYTYFSSKDDVLQALRDRLGAEILDQHERSLAELDPDDHVARLDCWMGDAILGRVERADLRDALFHRQRPAGSIHTSVVAAGSHVALLGDILQAGVDAGAFAIDDVDSTAVLLYGAMHSGVDALLDEHGGTETVRLVEATQRLARRAAGVPDGD
jgi:AcrR family transcriptional regulator